MPGPRRFVSAIAGELRSGRNEIVLLPKGAPNNLFGATRNEFASAEVPWYRINGELSDETPLDLIIRSLEPDCPHLHRTVQRYFEQSNLRGSIVWVDLQMQEDASSWVSFLEQYEPICRQKSLLSRVIFCLVLHGIAYSESRTMLGPCLGMRRYDNCTSLLDARLYAAIQLQGQVGSFIELDLISSMISCLAVWDPLLIDHLVSISVELVLSPKQVLREFASLRTEWKGNASGIDTSEPERRWGLGIEMRVANRVVTHAAFMSMNTDDDDEINRLVWMGQVAVMMPFLERRRVVLANQLASICEEPLRDEQDDLVMFADLELCRMRKIIELRKLRVPLQCQKELSRLCDARNALSHLRKMDAKSLFCDTFRATYDE